MRKPGAISVSILVLASFIWCVTLGRGAAINASHASNIDDSDGLVHEVIRNEIKSQTQDQTYWRFRELTEKDDHRELRDVVQTKEGEIYRVVALNGRALTPDGNRAENARIKKLLSHADDIKKDQQKRAEDDRKEKELLETFPDAFRYQNDGETGGLIRLRFTPNPHFSPTKRQEQVFHHMEGILWIDGHAKRLAGIEGILTSEVRFGGGIFGHLDKGGTFSVKMEDVGSGHWDLVSLDVHLTGKALLFKTISFQQKEHCSSYRQIPENTTLQQAAQLLEEDAGKQVAANRN